MVNFKCLKCNIFFTISHERDGHHRLVHQSTYQIRIVIGRIILNRSIDNKFLCPIDSYTRTFGHSDNLQSHFKVQHWEQNNLALHQHLEDNVQKAMSIVVSKNTKSGLPICSLSLCIVYPTKCP
jgi:hypothetical protein